MRSSVGQRTEQLQGYANEIICGAEDLISYGDMLMRSSVGQRTDQLQDISNTILCECYYTHHPV